MSETPPNSSDNKTTQRITLTSGAPQHEFTPDDGVKGGSANTPLQRIARSLNLRKYCTPTCEIYERCFARELSLSPSNKTDHGYLCTLKTMPERVQNSTFNILTRGEAGIHDIMRDLISRLMTITKITDSKDLRETIKAIKVASEMLYGTKNRTELTGKVDLTDQFIKAVEDSIKDESIRGLEGSGASLESGPSSVCKGSSEEGARPITSKDTETTATK